MTLCRLIHLKNTVRCCSPWPTACWAARWRRKTSCRRRICAIATPPASIRTLKSFLTTIVHHLCIDHLRSAQAQRENYVGPWLPEPILTGFGAAPMSPLHQITDRESISMAFLVLLESLSPLERAVFLLREVFDYEYAEIAQITGRDEAACRQLYSRAKKHIREHRPRFPASPEAHAKMVGQFMEACMPATLTA